MIVENLSPNYFGINNVQETEHWVTQESGAITFLEIQYKSEAHMNTLHVEYRSISRYTANSIHFKNFGTEKHCVYFENLHPNRIESETSREQAYLHKLVRIFEDKSKHLSLLHDNCRRFELFVSRMMEAFANQCASGVSFILTAVLSVFKFSK